MERDFMITKETYTNLIYRSRKDERLQLSDRIFLDYMINYLDVNQSEYMHLSMRDLEQEMQLSMGAITNAIPHLQECGYIAGGLFPKMYERREYDCWRLYLADLPPVPEAEPKKQHTKKPPLDVYEHRHGNIKVTTIIEEV